MKRLIVALVVAAFLVPNVPAFGAEVSHDRAQELCRSGKIICLGRILKRVKRSCPGRILDVELHTNDSGRKGWIYVVRVLTAGGHGVRILLNAKTGEIVKLKPSNRCGENPLRGSD